MVKNIVKTKKIKRGIKEVYEATIPFRLKLYNLLKVMKRGYDETSWVLWLTGVIGVLTSFFNLQLSGGLAWLLFLIFFYAAGKFIINTEKEMSEKNAGKAKS